MFSSLLALISPSYSIYPSLRSAGRVWLSPARPAWVVSGPFRFIAHARARFVVDVLSWRRSCVGTCLCTQGGPGSLSCCFVIRNHGGGPQFVSLSGSHHREASDAGPTRSRTHVLYRGHWPDAIYASTTQHTVELFTSTFHHAPRSHSAHWQCGMRIGTLAVSI